MLVRSLLSNLGDIQDILAWLLGEVRVVGFPEMRRGDFRGNELMGDHRQELIEGLDYTLGESNGGLGLWHTPRYSQHIKSAWLSSGQLVHLTYPAIPPHGSSFHPSGCWPAHESLLLISGMEPPGTVDDPGPFSRCL